MRTIVLFLFFLYINVVYKNAHLSKINKYFFKNQWINSINTKYKERKCLAVKNLLKIILKILRSTKIKYIILWTRLIELNLKVFVVVKRRHFLFHLDSWTITYLLMFIKNKTILGQNSELRNSKFVNKIDKLKFCESFLQNAIKILHWKVVSLFWRKRMNF